MDFFSKGQKIIRPQTRHQDKKMAKKNPPRKSVSVLVPVYNEEKTISEILNTLISPSFITEIVVVDDGSKDNTRAILEKVKNKKVRIYLQPRNQGKTAAIKRAIKEATCEILVVQDADLEYDPYELESVLDPIWKGQADVVYGSRFLVKKATRVLYYYHYIANKFLTNFCNFFTNLNMTDIETCYKAARAPIFKNLELTSKGFGMEVEITAMISRLPIRIYEVPISYYGRTYEEGKKIGMKDGIQALWYIVYFNLRSRLSSYRTYRKNVLDELEG